MKKKIRNRAAGVIISTLLLLNSVPISGILPYISLPHWFDKSIFMTVTAEVAPETIFDNKTSYNFNSLSEFISYCDYYKRYDSFADFHENDSITIAIMSGSTELDTDFVGLGSADHPFAGSVTFASTGSYTMSAHRAFFSYLSDKAIIKGSDNTPFTLVLNRLSDVADGESAPILADYVKHDKHDKDLTTANLWQVQVEGSCTFSGAIGTIENDAHVNLTFINNTGNNVISNAVYGENCDVGMFCGTLGADADLTVNYTGEINSAITSTNGNAGGIVGTMAENSTLNINGLSSISPQITANGDEANKKGYAGGLVGKLNSTATVQQQTVSVDTTIIETNLAGLSIGGTVTGTSGAGGVYGYYQVFDTAGDATVPQIDLNDYNVIATTYGKYCGGLFGVLDTTGDMMITNTAGSAKAYSSQNGDENASSYYYGGVAGKFTTNALTNTTTLSSMSIAPTASAKFSAFGGVFGIVDSAAYIKTDSDVSVSATGSANATTFGGLIGATSTVSDVFIDLGNFTLNTNKTDFKGGGIVGQFNNGVLRLTGITDMTNAKPKSEANCGQLVGSNNNVLVYTPDSTNWTFNRSNGANTDDLGTWGEVVRIYDIETDILAFDNTAHTVTVKPAETSMSTPTDFVKTALNIQLNQGSNYGCLIFEGDGRTTLLVKNLTLNDDISLANTGITGFMRDGGNVEDIGSFTGTLNGNGYTITLAIGETYGTACVEGQTDGMGQIYRHPHNGLFSVLEGTVQNLTIDGSINVRNCIDGMNIGGVAARNGGDITLTNVTVKETVNYHENTNVSGSESAGKNIGGFIGFVGDDGTITINGKSSIESTFNLSGKHQNWNVYGGAIGKITANQFTVEIGEENNPANQLTNKLTVDVSNVSEVGENNDGGGLIGYITNENNAKTNYNERVVNLNSLVYDGCTVSNAAKTNGGGFLGYAWMNTMANINGVTIQGGSEIENYTTKGTAGGNKNVGAMCYVATGKWTVDSLDVQTMSISNGCSSSLGMLVNQAYYTTNNIMHGLYIDVLNSGYTLGTVTLPSLAKFDEIAAYTADNANAILSGGYGVVSVNMNTDRTVKETNITKTGTYQNRLTGVDKVKYANPTSRYYYNLDVCNSSDDAQNILLWSVNRYAASNIQGEFISTFPNNTLTGEADMTGLSFYPVYLTEGVTISNLSLTFDYNGIYSTAENAEDTDSYNRDPGEKNQHYLMHSGLFLNTTAGSTLTISGALSLNGNFLEVDNYSGVLINNTMSGSLICKNGSISLNGIVAKTKDGAEHSDGYLLLHKLNRASDTVAVPKLQLYNVSTGEGYTVGEHFKSLIGPASGLGLEIEFSKIKLDARKTAGTADDAMSVAYHTTKSIFKNSTLLESIKTDNNAKLTYNYTYDDDWLNDDRNVTYGYEISGSVEYAEKERKYSSCSGDNKKRYYTNPISAPDTSSSEYIFEDYLKYVYNNNEEFTGTADSNGYYYRELKVNVETDGLTEGCGTYNDPYIINSAAQLTAIAAFLRDSSKPKVLGDVCLPNTKPESFESGNRWCEDKAAHAIYTAGDSYFENLSATATEWTNENIQRYLASAYYKITADITLEESFYGLGGTTANTAFRGVIVGDKDSKGIPKYTITNPTDNPFIMVSNGCVVKDLNITIAKQDGINKVQVKNTYNEAYFGYNHIDGKICKFYGGIIGEVMGGDNIIDNSYVTFDESSKITLSGGSGTIVPVGGYVGVVVFGGVIFKNMDSRKTTLESTNLNVVYTGKKYNLADNSGQEAWAAIYVNPIVGRVINGYAVNETGGNALDANGNKVQQFSQSEDGTYHDEDGSTRENVTEHTLKNGKKHYSIADIDPKLEKLDVESVPSNALTDGVINISNSQAFFILSLITQSTSGTAQTATGGYVKSLSYGTNDSNVYGMSHTGSYADVGTSESTSADFTDCASGDTAANTAVPYIISRFTKRTDDIINSIIETTYSTYTGEVAGLDGKTFRISNRNGSKQYFGNGISSNKLTYTSKEADAALWTFEKYSDSTYYISIYVNESIKYMCMDGTNGNMSLADSKDTATAFTVISYKNKFVLNSGSYYVNRYGGNNLTGFAGWTAYINDTGSQHDLVQQIITEREEIIYGGYNARCVTSTLGYYDINLTGSEYVLPDSFRGLGSVGYYDDTSDKSNKFSIKLDVLSGNNCTIDKDIYLNKYHVDNYFNVLHKNNSAKQDISSNVISDIKETTVNDSKTFHGIGLFDSVIMKGQSSSISKITVSGSLNTEIYNNSYTSSKTEQEKKEYNVKESLFLACGGVIGWSTGTQWCNFNKVNLDSLSIRGSCFVAGLLGYSGNNSKDVYVTVQECNVNDLALCLTAASYTKTDDKDKRRFGMGAYVGKVFQGGVLVYGTDMKDRNNKLDNFSTVKLSKYEIPDNSFSICAGGLVGYAGHGLKAYDVKVEPQTDKTIINIGEIPDDQANATAIAGGIVGLMQPQSINDEDIKSCTATFINCEVKNINIAGEYAGGLYGGTWGKVGSQDSAWVPYMINLENCKITGLDSTNKNTIKATKLAGGAVAYAKVSKAGNPNFLISNTTISNYKIDANDNQYAGGFMGYAEVNDRTSIIVCFIHDSSVENCEIGTGTTYSGGAIGGICKPHANAGIKANQILGYNIKLNNVTSSSSSMGAWIGFVDNADTTTSIQFTGLGIYGNGFAKNVGNKTNFTNASFILSDYTGQCNDETPDATPDVSGLNKGDTVDMPKYPFVNIFPQSALGTGEILSGDGAVLGNEVVSTYSSYPSKNTMAAKIYSEMESSGTSKQYYNTFDDGLVVDNNKIDTYLKRTTEDDGDRISTFATEQGITLPSGVDDFAVLVIATSNDMETTNLINRYIQLVTNTPNSGATANFADTSAGYHKLEVKTCKLDADTGSFTIMEESSPGLTYDKDNKKFSLDVENADSLDTNTFTLLDVQFLDPFGKEKIAYHLYVPIYTVREMPVNFYAIAKTGAHSAEHPQNSYAEIISNYANIKNEYNHADSLDTWMTHYIRYEYQAKDINTLLNSGKLQWNYQKQFNFETFTAGDDDNPLPGSTYMTLVDPNANQDEVYYAKIEDMSSYKVVGNGRIKDCWTIELKKFQNDNNKNFSSPTFNAMIAKDIDVTEKLGTGKYDKVERSDAYDVYVIKDGETSYYKYNTDNQGDYDLTVAENYTLCEDYYLSIYVPKPKNYGTEIYHYKAIAPNQLDANNIDYSGEDPKIHSAGVTQPFKCNLMVADLFKQTVDGLMTVTPNNEQITANNKKITVDISALIEPNSKSGVFYVNSDEFFHSFYLTLIRNSENGIESDIKGLKTSNITAKYSINSKVTGDSPVCANVDLNDYYLNIQTAPADKSSELVGHLQGENQKFTVYARFEMDFDEDQLSDEFPIRETGNEYGVNVRAASNLAYDSDTLPYTSMTKSYAQDIHYYYIEAIPSAILTYSMKKGDMDQYDEIGFNSKNQSTLGVNGRSAAQAERTNMPINTEAFYNVQSLSDAKNAKILRLTFALNKKVDSGDPITGVDYQSIDSMQNYLDGTITFTSGNAVATVEATGGSVTVDLDATKCNVSGGIYDIDITFNAKSGSEFTEYANYKVNLKAELFKEENGEGNVENSVAEDYLIYTNAKINPNILADLKSQNN